MRQVTLASQASFERYGKKTRWEKFLEEMDRIMPWAELESLSGRIIPRKVMGVRQWDLASCFAFTFSSTGSTYPILLPKRHCTTRRPCGGLRAWICAVRQRWSKRPS